MKKEALHKKCSRCGAIKPLSDFSPRKDREIGVRSKCKKCTNELTLIYSHSVYGIVTRIYSDQRKTSKHRRHASPKYSKEELRYWLLSQYKFHLLYDSWVNSNFNKYLKPSVDRIDDYKPYSLDNIRLCTWRENLDKANSDKRNGINNKDSTPVFGISKKDGNRIDFVSIQAAQRGTGANQSAISMCCSDKYTRKSAGGYSWFYTNKE